jgi:hypothetical protein
LVFDFYFYEREITKDQGLSWFEILFVRSRWLFLFYSRNAKIGTEKVGGKDEKAVSSHFLVANSIGFSDFTKALGGMSN